MGDGSFSQEAKIPTELVSRLEVATEGSRGLDQLVSEATGWVLTDGLWRYPPKVTTSLDAALGLAERVLPGCFPGVQRNRWTVHDGPDWSAYLTPADSSGEVEADGATAPLALCIAILKAAVSDDTPLGTEAQPKCTPKPASKGENTKEMGHE